MAQSTTSSASKAPTQTVNPPARPSASRSKRSKPKKGRGVIRRPAADLAPALSPEAVGELLAKAREASNEARDALVAYAKSRPGLPGLMPRYPADLSFDYKSLTDTLADRLTADFLSPTGIAVVIEYLDGKLTMILPILGDLPSAVNPDGPDVAVVK